MRALAGKKKKEEGKKKAVVSVSPVILGGSAKSEGTGQAHNCEELHNRCSGKAVKGAQRGQQANVTIEK